MSSNAVVIGRIVFQNPAQMFLAQDNDVVQTLTPKRSDQPFGKAILPRRGWCSGLVPDAHGTQSARDDNAIDSIPISDHIARSHVPGKRLGDLTCNPLRRRVGCDVNPDEISAIKPVQSRSRRAFGSQWSGRRTNPWRQCPARGFAERSATPGLVVLGA